MNFIDKQLAIKLKEKGFDRPCFNAYNAHGCQYVNGWCEYLDARDNDLIYLSDLHDKDCLCPTIEQILKWLREDKDIHIKSDICFRYTSEHKKDKNGTYSGYMDVSKPFWSFLIRKIKNGNCVYDNTTASNNEYFSYEDACIAGIEYVINNNLI